MKRTTALFAVICLMIGMAACSPNTAVSETQNIGDQSKVSESADVVPDASEADSTQTEDSDNKMDKENNMVIVWNGKEYAVQVEDSVTAGDIMEKLPLDLTMTQFGGHEYYSELDFRPEFAEDRTSQIKAGHIYYWDGWNAFVINYIDWDITPYEVVHIGEITDKSIVDGLLQADGDITVTIKQVEEESE